MTKLCQLEVEVLPGRRGFCRRPAAWHVRAALFGEWSSWNYCPEHREHLVRWLRSEGFAVRSATYEPVSSR